MEERLIAEADRDVSAQDAVETFSEYVPCSVNVGCAHPDSVVETATLASVTPPQPTYKLGLPLETLQRGLLSSLQLEAIIYACGRHEVRLGLTGGRRVSFIMLMDGHSAWRVISLRDMPLIVYASNNTQASHAKITVNFVLCESLRQQHTAF